MTKKKAKPAPVDALEAAKREARELYWSPKTGTQEMLGRAVEIGFKAALDTATRQEQRTPEVVESHAQIAIRALEAAKKNVVNAVVERIQEATDNGTNQCGAIDTAIAVLRGCAL